MGQGHLAVGVAALVGLAHFQPQPGPVGPAIGHAGRFPGDHPGGQPAAQGQIGVLAVKTAVMPPSMVRVRAAEHESPGIVRIGAGDAAKSGQNRAVPPGPGQAALATLTRKGGL